MLSKGKEDPEMTLSEDIRARCNALMAAMDELSADLGVEVAPPRQVMDAIDFAQQLSPQLARLEADGDDAQPLHDKLAHRITQAEADWARFREPNPIPAYTVVYAGTDMADALGVEPGGDRMVDRAPFGTAEFHDSRQGFRLLILDPADTWRARRWADTTYGRDWHPDTWEGRAAEAHERIEASRDERDDVMILAIRAGVTAYRLAKATGLAESSLGRHRKIAQELS